MGGSEVPVQARAHDVVVQGNALVGGQSGIEIVVLRSEVDVEIFELHRPPIADYRHRREDRPFAAGANGPSRAGEGSRIAKYARHAGAGGRASKRPAGSHVAQHLALPAELEAE